MELEYLPLKKMLCNLVQSLEAASVPEAGLGDQVMQLMKGSGTGVCALNATLLLETLLMRKKHL